MKRSVVTAALLLLCISFPTSMEARDKRSSVDMSNMNRIFLGWVDLNPDEFLDLGYSKGDWTDVISAVNSLFQRNCQSRYLPDRTVTAAKDKGDEYAAGNDLYIKFSDVSFDTSYRLHLSIHFIDPKTNSEIASVPGRTYAAHLCGLVSCLETELDQVGTRLQVAVTTRPKGKKK